MTALRASRPWPGWFRREFYGSLNLRADALFELTDAVRLQRDRL
jgi:hypothetical protein